MRRVGEPMNTWVDRISQACGLSDFVPFTRSFCNSRTRVQAYGMPGLNLAYAAFRRVEVVQHLAHGLAQPAFVLAHLIILSENGFERLERAFQGAGASNPAAAQAPHTYRPENVGNDASARPWERSSMAFDASRQAQGSGVVIGSGLAGSQNWGIPAGFDAEGFVSAAKRNFVTLQAAWDRSDIATLRSMMTDGMLEEIRAQLAERESQRGAEPNHTDVVMIEAQLLGIEEMDDRYMASVEFSGMIREELSAGPSPFREVWNMTKSKSGNSGWLVAGVQALQ